MGVEFLEHSTDGILYEFVLVDGVDIQVGDGHFCPLEFGFRTFRPQALGAQGGGSEQQHGC